jgi:N-acetyl-gamma-glutamyl-phosphate reductase
MKISVVGATAYTSRELLKILARHPEAEIVHLGGRREGNPPISEVFTGLRGVCDLPVLGLHLADAPEKPELAFFTLPHAVSHQYVPEYLEAGVRCIDFSADYRLRDLSVYEAWYGEHGDVEHFGTAAYGVTELWRDEIAGAELVAVAGCYPTAALLAVAPLVRAGLIDLAGIVVDAKSGVSGRGNKPNEGSMYCECNEDVRAYSVGGHRHEPELEEALGRLCPEGAGAVDVAFVPHLVPMDRGIQSSVYATLTRDAEGEELQALYEEFYAGEPFLRVLPPGEQPRTKDVAFTNFCDVAVTARGRRVIATSAIDNLMKGASSQAVQDMNVMFGRDETTALL